jgi:hypothetical protein
MSEQANSAPIPEPLNFDDAERIAAERSVSIAALYESLLAGVLVGNPNDPRVRAAIATVRSWYPADFDRLLSSVFIIAKFIRDRGPELRHVDMIEALYLYMKHSRSTVQFREAALASPRLAPDTSGRVN